MMEKHDLAFWLAVAGATVVKVLTSQFGGPVKLVATVFAALFSAYFFTTPAMHWLGLDPDVYTTMMAAVMALTGEGAMRFAIGASNDPTKLLDFLRQWRSGK